MESGEYICTRYASTEYRKKKRIVLFLQPTNGEGIPTTDDDVPVVGYFVEQEIERIGGEEGFLWKAKQPVLCRIGAEKTTPQNKKEKQFYIVADVEKEKIAWQNAGDMEYWQSAAEIPPGEYLCNRYGSTIYRKKKKILSISIPSAE